MFNWIKGSSPSRIRQETSRNRSFFWKKRSTSMVSLSPIVDHETLTNVQQGDDLSTPKDSRTSRQSNRVTRVIGSMFQRRLRADKRENRLTANLLDDAGQADGNKFLEEEETKKAKRRFKGATKKVFLQQHKKKLFKRKPLDDYAKRKLQISRDLEWDSRSTSSVSLSSLLNEEAAFSASSPITKANTNEKSAGISSMEQDRRAVRRKTLLFTRRDVEGLFMEISSPEEDLMKPLDDDSFLLTDSGIGASRDSSNLNDSSDQSRSTVDIDKSRGWKFSCSVNCLVHLIADVESCSKCALSCDVFRSQGEARARSPVKLSSRVAEHSQESRVIKRSMSVGCIPTYIKSPLKNSEHSSPAAASHEKPADVKNLRVDGQLEHRRLIDETLPKRTRLWISKSTSELLDEDSLCCQYEVAEFSSLADLPFWFWRHSGTDDDCGSNSNKFPVNEEAKGTLDEDTGTRSTEVQCVSALLGYETETNVSRSFNSFNGSYVLTMYV